MSDDLETVTTRDLEFTGPVTAASDYDDEADILLSGLSVTNDVIQKFNELCEIHLGAEVQFRADVWAMREFAVPNFRRDQEAVAFLPDLDGVYGDGYTGGYHGVVTGRGDLEVASYGETAYWIGPQNISQTLRTRLAQVLLPFADTHETLAIRVALQMGPDEGGGLPERGMPVEEHEERYPLAPSLTVEEADQILPRNRYRAGHDVVPAPETSALHPTQLDIEVTGMPGLPPGVTAHILMVQDTATSAAAGLVTDVVHGEGAYRD